MILVLLLAITDRATELCLVPASPKDREDSSCPLVRMMYKIDGEQLFYPNAEDPTA